MKKLAGTLVALTLAAGTAAATQEGDVTGKALTEELQTLMDTAEAEGLVRVIVALKVPENALNEAGTGSVNSIDHAKMILQTALPLDDAPLVDPIAGQPVVVMEVSARGLDFLLGSPLVAQIAADTATGITPVEPSPETDETPSFGGNGHNDLAAPQTDN